MSLADPTLDEIDRLARLADEGGTNQPPRTPEKRAVIWSEHGPFADSRPTIEIRAGELHMLATKGENALIGADAPLYVRGGLVRPIVDDLPASHGRRAKVARLADVTGDALVDYLSRSADWVRFNARKKELVLTDPPRAVAATILSRDGEWRFPRLAGVITTPTLRPDGSILSSPGYDPKTQLLLLDPPELPAIPRKPTRDDALQALETLDGLLEEFPFVDNASRSVALSGLITPVVRGAMPVAPLHAYSAPVAGTGKSYVVDLASAISTGQRAPVIAAGQNDEETEKRLGAALLSGQPVVTIDNVNGRLGGDALCQLIERPVVSVRPLGVSKLVRIESRATCFATGNNIQLVGDMTRRVLLCSLDPNMERPELRTFHDNPFEAVLANRGRYIAAALTISSAYMAAGCPGDLPALASFDAWSRVVRSALVWLGRADPIETMEAARAEDPVIASLRSLYAAWYAATGSTSRTTGAMKELAEELNPFGNRCQPDLHRALCDVAEDRRGAIDTRKLGQFLGRHKGRIVDGLKLQDFDDNHTKQKVWSIARV
jgi:putative DNA primase/helicase